MVNNVYQNTCIYLFEISVLLKTFKALTILFEEIQITLG